MAITVCLVLVSFCGCRMTKRQISQYEVVDYNLIWDKGDAVIRSNDFVEYYSISGVSKNEVIARQKSGGYPLVLGEPRKVPEVLLHQDKKGEYTLDETSARFALRRDWFENGTNVEKEQYWMNLGDYHRTQVLDPIDEQIAKAIILELSANPRKYQTLDYLQTWDFLHFKSKEIPYSILTIEIYLKEYENILWMGEIVKCEDMYLIAIHTSQGGYDFQYLRCNDELTVLIEQIVEKYGLLY